MFKKRKQLMDAVESIQSSISSLKLVMYNQESLLEHYKDELIEAIKKVQKGLDDLAPYNMMLHNEKSIITSVGYFVLPQDPFVISKPHTPSDFELNVIILRSRTEPTYVEVWCKDEDEIDLVYSKLLSIYGCTQLN